jgi:hypothetical protein
MESRSSSASVSSATARRLRSLARKNTPRRCSVASNTQSERGNRINGQHKISLRVTNTDETHESQDLVAIFSQEVRTAAYELMEEGFHAIATVYRATMALGRLSMRTATLSLAVGGLTLAVGARAYAMGKRLWSKFFG